MKVASSPQKSTQRRVTNCGFGEPNRFTRRDGYLVAANIMLMVGTAQSDDQLRRQIETLLRDEFADLERQVVAGCRSADDDA
jgi:hypothetical protein